MNKLLTTIILICCSIGATAQEKEIWACQQLESTMLSWNSDGWDPYRVTPKPLLLTINGLIPATKKMIASLGYSVHL